ncbi:MAG: hypothetical protein HY736_08315 [Verrucomicrobia bacterium]|nr:hypothetical protein [Verrucomicrobiota bacterium]
MWPLPPQTRDPAPGWLLRLATTLAGGEMNTKGVLEERKFDGSAFDEVRAELAALPKDAPYVEWGRWFLADRATRSIAPGFTITPVEAEKLAKEMAAPASPPAAPATTLQP